MKPLGGSRPLMIALSLMISTVMQKINNCDFKEFEVLQLSLNMNILTYYSMILWELHKYPTVCFSSFLQ